MLPLIREVVVGVVFGKTTQIGHAQQGVFAATAYVVEGGELLLRITPGVFLTEFNLSVWFTDFEPFTREVFATSVSLYASTEKSDWDIRDLKEYFGAQLSEFVSFLDGLVTGDYFDD